jgi:hypothetical protein
VVIGKLIKTPVLLMFELFPLKNLFASGSHILIGQERFVLISLRCSTNVSTTVSIFIILLFKVVPSIFLIIGYVNLVSLGYLVKIGFFR